MSPRCEWLPCSFLLTWSKALMNLEKPWFSLPQRFQTQIDVLTFTEFHTLSTQQNLGASRPNAYSIQLSLFACHMCISNNRIWYFKSRVQITRNACSIQPPHALSRYKLSSSLFWGICTFCGKCKRTFWGVKQARNLRHTITLFVHDSGLAIIISFDY